MVQSKAMGSPMWASAVRQRGLDKYAMVGSLSWCLRWCSVRVLGVSIEPAPLHA